MRFCSECGRPVSLVVPEGDNLPRHVCTGCGTIHYKNPKIVAGAVLEYQGRILMCKRAIDPRYGLWTVPAGFMENDETVHQAAARETWEEAVAVPGRLELYGVYNLPHVNQVYIMFQGSLAKPEYGAGPESLEVELMEESQIPWDEMAFRVVTMTLEKYFKDRKHGDFRPFTDDVVKNK